MVLVCGFVTMFSCVAAVEASMVDEVDGIGSSAVEELPFVVCVFVLHLQLFLHQLVALPQCHILDPFNLSDTFRTQHVQSNGTALFSAVTVLILTTVGAF